MSASSPNPGRILRSHAKKPEESKEKEKEKDVKPQAGGEKESGEKDKKKRKSKPTHNTSTDEAHDSEIDVGVKMISKPGKKRRKINTRTAHSDGEQEFVELGSSSKVCNSFLLYF